MKTTQHRHPSEGWDPAYCWLGVCGERDSSLRWNDEPGKSIAHHSHSPLPSHASNV